MTYTGVVVVIPTRNRATIAMNAIRSVLSQPTANAHVMISDNSSSEQDRKALHTFCSTVSDSRLRYVRPAQSLAMSAHWNWAIEAALNFYPDVSHFLYLTDRMMLRKDALSDITGLAVLYPGKVISYNQDRIVDDANPIRIDQYPGSGKLLEVDTLRLSWLLSQAVIHPAVPRMLNCIVPRPVLNRIREHFGNVFSSISPDFNFCCRCIELEDSILFYDKSPMFHYALSRSNGASATRGEMSADYTDFRANLPEDSSMNLATPIPQLTTAVNYAFHEYSLFKQQSKSNRFFELDPQKYLEANAKELPQISNPKVRTEILSLLVAHGYREDAPNNDTGARRTKFGKRLRSKLNRFATSPWTTSAWLFAGRYLGIRPPGQNQFEFANLIDAIDYSANISTGNFTKQSSQEEFLRAREMLK
jgi:hypothetical protein